MGSSRRRDAYAGRRISLGYAAAAGEAFAGEGAKVTAHTGCLVLARTDGKSPAQFLDPSSRTGLATSGSRAPSTRERNLAMAVIDHNYAWEALDSSGTPTVACAVGLESGAEGEAIVHLGRVDRVARGARAAGRWRALRGKGVAGAVATSAPRSRPNSRAAMRRPGGIDTALRALDGTANLARLGAQCRPRCVGGVRVRRCPDRGVPLWQASARTCRRSCRCRW